MCLPRPPKIPPPARLPTPPPPPEAAPKAPALNVDSSSTGIKRKGRSSLRIDLNPAISTNLR